ncbi:MAG TPA: hypothetical protein VKS20_14525 [Candidatus Acidoferrales bacterium]|nr:hypothetical protein [Candidatus Acidoferrales bacterium]
MAAHVAYGNDVFCTEDQGKTFGRASNPGSRTDVLCKGVLGIETTPHGFVVTCRRIEIAPKTEKQPPAKKE